jgi:GGDEF domain-containing protein
MQHDRVVKLGRRLVAVEGGFDADRDSLFELGLIARDLTAKPDVETALIAVAGPNGSAEVLAAAPGERPPQRSHDFVSRAVRADRPMIESLEPGQEPSLGTPVSGGWPAYAISAPISVSGGAPAALCAGMSGPPPGFNAPVGTLLDAYARLAAFSLRERRRLATRLAAGRDDLTGCLTYAAVLHRLHRELARCRRLDLELTCCFVGLQPAAGGHLDGRLEAAARAIRTVIAGDDAIGRFGRDQFIVLLPGTGVDAGVLLGELMLERLRTNERDQLDARVGVAQWIRGTRADRLLGDASHSLTGARTWPARSVAATG